MHSGNSTNNHNEVCITVDTTQMLWGVNSLLIVILGFMVRSWVTALTNKLGCKQDKVVCNERCPHIQQDIVNLFSHKHPIVEDKNETGGVIIP